MSNIFMIAAHTLSKILALKRLFYEVVYKNTCLRDKGTDIKCML